MILIRKEKLPPRVFAVTIKEGDDLLVCVNNACSPETQKAALRGELAHVDADAFHGDPTRSRKEVEACGSIFGISAKK